MGMPKRPGGLLLRSSDPMSNSLIFPILATGRDLLRKAYLGPVSITVIFVVALLSADDPLFYNVFLAGYLAWAGYYFIYCLCGKSKPWWLLLGTALTTGLLVLSPLFTAVFDLLFRQLLFQDFFQALAKKNLVAMQQYGGGYRFLAMFSGAGLMEELTKALPVYGAYWLGTRLKSPWRERVGVWEPLDGIVLGAASAVGFTLLETLGQYVPDAMQQGAAVGVKHGLGLGLGLWAGLRLLIPRMVGAVMGHMAYSGYLGYFIGLSILQ